MAGDKIVLPDLEIIYKDVWVMLYLYRVTRYWFYENGWNDLTNNPDHQNIEHLYLERRGTSFSPTHRELRIWWRVQKVPLFVGRAYYNYRLDFEFNGIQMTDVEVVKDDKKIKAQHGELRITIKPFIQLETHPGIKSPSWSKHFLLRYIESYFKQRVLKRTLEDHKKELYREAYRLQGMLKKYLELKTFLPEMETFQEKFEHI
ncbi:hypothetical protein HY640_02835 [Candidatus Woesearchaeota archaeon]|nr:hypothetical protein [Candidatus Woesearchaeota archaeon]